MLSLSWYITRHSALLAVPSLRYTSSNLVSNLNGIVFTLEVVSIVIELFDISRDPGYCIPAWPSTVTFITLLYGFMLIDIYFINKVTWIYFRFRNIKTYPI
jgi:hypothetical protein